MRFKATVAYDGTEFAGFQKQPVAHRTVQRDIEDSLYAIFNNEIPIVGAGRTDSGVHASGQVIAFNAEWRHSAQALQNAINAKLPKDIAVLQLKETDAEFHPRYDAQKRLYTYRIYNAPLQHPLYRRVSWWVKSPLDVGLMNNTAVTLLGTHNFATFGQPPQGTNTERTIFQAFWEVQAPYLQFTVQGNAFLYRMVRSIVGSLKLVGEGAWSVEKFEAAFHAADRSFCGAVAPPQGVCLEAVEY